MITLRAHVNAELEAPLNDKEWAMIENGELLRRYSAGKIGPSGIAAEIRQLRDAFGAKSPPSLPTKIKAPPARSARTDLLSFLITKYAGHLPFVSECRQQILPGGMLLEEASITDWILQTVDSEGFTPWLRLPMPGVMISDPKVKSLSKWSEQKQCLVPVAEFPFENVETAFHDAEVEYRWLRYSSETGTKSVPTSALGNLEKLRVCAERLAREITCTSEDAVNFILSGRALVLYPCFQTISVVTGDKLGALNRIRLDIDPTLSPREVSNVYREMRKKVFGKRYRAMSEKHIRLALFSWGRQGGELLKVAMADWNRLFPKWRYRAQTNFGRDKVAAVRRAFATLHAPSTNDTDVTNWMFRVDGTESEKRKGSAK